MRPRTDHRCSFLLGVGLLERRELACLHDAHVLLARFVALLVLHRWSSTPLLLWLVSLLGIKIRKLHAGVHLDVRIDWIHGFRVWIVTLKQDLILLVESCILILIDINRLLLGKCLCLIW